MDKSLACHSIALEASKMYTESNKPAYTVDGYSKLVQDMTDKYIEAYEQARNTLSQVPSAKIKTSKLY